MAVTQIAHGVWTSSFGGHRFDSLADAKRFDDRERRRHPASVGTRVIDSLSTEQIEAITREAQAMADEAAGRQSWTDIQSEFVAAHPEYIKNAANGDKLGIALAAKGKLGPDGRCTASYADLESAFYDLVDCGAMQVKAGVDRRPFDEADAYTMPMDELWRRAKDAIEG